MFSIISLLFTLLPVATASPAQLSAGRSMEYGTVSSILNWQSSGLLYDGCDSSIKIRNCYTLSLTNNPNKQLDPGFPSARQRIEFRSPNQPDGSSWKYIWKHHLNSGVGTSDNFFHLMQLFSTGDGGPIVTLDAVAGRVAIKDFARSCSDTGCPSMSLAAFEGRTTRNTAIVSYGPHGNLYYVVTDASSGATLLSYNVSGAMGTGGSYIKFGTYRATYSGMSSSTATCGEFTMQQL